jgi:hypothetical protein
LRGRIGRDFRDNRSVVGFDLIGQRLQLSRVNGALGLQGFELHHDIVEELFNRGVHSGLLGDIGGKLIENGHDFFSLNDERFQSLNQHALKRWVEVMIVVKIHDLPAGVGYSAHVTKITARDSAKDPIKNKKRKKCHDSVKDVIEGFGDGYFFQEPEDYCKRAYQKDDSEGYTENVHG